MRYLVHIRTRQGKWLPIWADPLPLESARELAQTVRSCNRRDGFPEMAFWIRPIFAGHCSETMH